MADTGAQKDEAGKISLSFGFSKKKENKKLTGSAIKDDDVSANVENATFVESFDGKRLSKDEKKKLVIPMIQNNRWQNPIKPEDLEKEEEVKTKEVKLVEGDTVESRAANEIIQAAAGVETSSKKDERTVPLLLQNKVPDGFETDDRLNVELRPESSIEADYEQIPIEQYGQALLRGMGWKEGMGIGRKGRLAKPVAAVLRPKGLGLGADRNLSKQAANGDSGKSKDTEELTLKKGVHCCINSGKHKDMYATVEGIDEDNARAVVKLALSKESVTMSQFALTLVSKKDFEKNSKVLNKSKVDKYKEDEERNKKKSHSRDDREEEKHSRHRDRHRDRQRDREEQDSTDRHKHKHEDRDRNKDRKRKHHESDNDRKKSKESHSHSMWLRPHLRVRIVDPEYKKGKYFKTKVIIEDVVGPGECICRTDEGKVLENINMSMLETVIPRNDPAYIMVVSGKQIGKLGEILRKDKASNSAMVQLLHDRDEVLELSFNDICDYTGNIEHEYDY